MTTTTVAGEPNYKFVAEVVSGYLREEFIATAQKVAQGDTYQRSYLDGLGAILGYLWGMTGGELGFSSAEVRLHKTVAGVR